MGDYISKLRIGYRTLIIVALPAAYCLSKEEKQIFNDYMVVYIVR